MDMDNNSESKQLFDLSKDYLDKIELHVIRVTEAIETVKMIKNDYEDLKKHISTVF